MSRRVDEFFNKSNFSEGIRLINEGEYATFDFESSYQAIIETQPEEIKKKIF